MPLFIVKTVGPVLPVTVSMVPLQCCRVAGEIGAIDNELSPQQQPVIV